MFIAKIKTATVVLFGVAALGLGTGGVVYQTRAGAADPQKKGQQLQQPNANRPLDPKPSFDLLFEQPQQPNAISPADRKKHLLADLDQLEKEQSQLLDKHKQIQKELASLDQRMGKIKLEIQEIEIVQAALGQTNPRTDQKPASGDKLDQILERLERLEKRLRRLERLEKRLDRLEGRKPEPSKP